MTRSCTSPRQHPCLNQIYERETTHQTRRELGPRADARAVPVKQERARREEERAEADERARPVDPEPLEHLHREERERRADGRAHDRVRRERRRRVLQVRVDEVRLVVEPQVSGAATGRGREDGGGSPGTS